MKIKELEQKLQSLSTFDQPNLLLEQYSTSAHIAARVLFTAHTQYDDIQNRRVADLGTGCGTLSIGAAILGASYVAGFDIDAAALQKLMQNCKRAEVSLEAICSDVTYHLPGRYRKFFETVIMNPPFGTKHNPGMDIKFLEVASKLSKSTIYSLHKSSTRSYILQKGKQIGLYGEVLAELKYDLPQTYRFHRKKSVDINVDFIRFSVN